MLDGDKKGFGKRRSHDRCEAGNCTFAPIAPQEPAIAAAGYQDMPVTPWHGNPPYRKMIEATNRHTFGTIM